MNDSPQDHAFLHVWAAEPFIPVVASFAEKMSLALGLGRFEALGLTLATEEVFSHLCQVVLPAGGWVKICCSGGGYFVQMEFMFPATNINMRAFNITATVSLADDAQIEEMGMLLASRSVDLFRVSRENGQGLKLTLVKEKDYPQRKDEGLPPSVKELRQFSVRPPDVGELKLFADLVSVHYHDRIVAEVCHSSGKLVDMVACGEYRAVVAVGPAGEIGGGTLWRGTNSRAVEWFGPYLFNQGSGSRIATALFDSCIGAIARTPAVVLINRFPTPEFPRQDFEYLGHVTHYATDGTSSRRDAWARLMREDLGSAVWLHPQLHGFVREEYARLFLPREIRLVEDQGERRASYSVLFAAFDRLQGSVTLQPVWWGEDLAKNLRQHLKLFRQEKILNVFFSLDLGHAWEANCVPGLLENGFKPCLVLPYAGAGDVIVFQCDGAAE